MTLRWQPYTPTIPSEQVDPIWEQRPPHIFNGSLLIHLASTIEADRIALTGAFIEYRYYYVQKRSGVDLGIAPIGVSGLILCDGHYVFARRSAAVTSYSGYLELVPSGGLDQSTASEDGQVDFAGKLQEEFAEEVGLPAHTLTSIKPFTVIYDPQDPVYDIGCLLRCSASLNTILASLSESEEYDDPIAVPTPMMPDWITQRRDEVVPTSLALLNALAQYKLQGKLL